MKPLILIVAVVVLMPGCANLPNGSVGYYLAKTSVSVKVVRTIFCDKADHPVVVSATTPIVSHVADTAKFVPISFAGLRGVLQDEDLKFDFYDDGRLKAINVTNTGQGEAILKTIISILPVVFGLNGGTGTYPTQCAFIRKHGDNQPLTLTYQGEVDLASSSPQTIKPDETSTFYDSQIRPAMGATCVVAAPQQSPPPPFNYSASADDVYVKAKQPGTVLLRVLVGREREPCTEETWKGQVPVAQLGTPYTLPIPKGAIFGTQTLAASFAESGALTSVQYVSKTGLGQLLNVANTAATTFKPESTADKVAELKAQADLIQAQQRLAACLADPTGCK